MSGAKSPRKRKRASRNLADGATSNHPHEQRNDSSKPGSTKRRHLRKEGAKTRNLSLDRFLSMPEACVARSLQVASVRVYEQYITAILGAVLREAEVAGLATHIISSSDSFHIRGLLLLDSNEIRGLWPGLPADLLGQLTWTSQRSGSTSSDTEKGQFYLKSDIIKLQERVQAMAHEPPSALNALQRELTRADKERKKAAFDIQVWQNKTLIRRDTQFSARWSKIQAALRSRWGWNPVPYEQLPTRLKDIVDYLIDVPFWKEARGDLTWTIKNRPPKEERHPRPFALPKSSQPSNSSTIGDHNASSDTKLTGIRS
ncbi:hypothetical protein FRB90_012091 [Tulasnella sp. 427]|nr:hypothetical protein FRB90_012091 [Tulasnella sp. 427]